MVALGGGVAAIRGFDVLFEYAPDRWNPFEEFDSLLLSFAGTIGFRIIRAAFMFVGTCHLFAEGVVQAIHQIAHVVGDIPLIEVLTSPVSGKDNLEEVVKNPDHGIAARQRFVAEVMQHPAVGIGID